jgi:nitrite reductase/ring-hydroxylating ferredoxin subunit
VNAEAALYATRAFDTRPLPAWPSAWYVVGRSSDFASCAIREGSLADRDYVIYRDTQGTLVALDAHCPHMGAHLRSGRVVDGGLRCALHHGTLDRDGVMRDPTHARGGATSECAVYRSRSWPICERFGLVFLHLSDAMPATDPFATFEQGFEWLPGRPLDIGADWRAMLVNGFDTHHMAAVHQREVVYPPTLSRTTDGGVRMTYQTRVLAGGGLSSWLTDRLSRGAGVLGAQTCHGTTIMVDSRLGALHSRAVFGLLPTPTGTRAFGAFGVPRESKFRRTRLRLTRALYLAFLRKDFRVVEAMRLITEGITDPGVRGVSEFLRSLANMEQEHDRVQERRAR